MLFITQRWHLIYTATHCSNFIIIRSFTSKMCQEIKLNLFSVDITIYIHDHGFDSTTIHSSYHL